MSKVKRRKKPNTHTRVIIAGSLAQSINIATVSIFGRVQFHQPELHIWRINEIFRWYFVKLVVLLSSLLLLLPQLFQCSSLALYCVLCTGYFRLPTLSRTIVGRPLWFPTDVRKLSIGRLLFSSVSARLLRNLCIFNCKTDELLGFIHDKLIPTNLVWLTAAKMISSPYGNDQNDFLCMSLWFS